MLQDAGDVVSLSMATLLAKQEEWLGAEIRVCPSTLLRQVRQALRVFLPWLSLYFTGSKP